MKTVNTAQRKARKIHKCDYCNLVIEVGEIYERSFIVGDGARTWKNHIICQKTAENIDMFKQSGDEGVNGDSFAEFVNMEYEFITNNPYRSVTFLERLNTVEKYHGLENQLGRKK